MTLTLRPQEISFDDPRSRYFFEPGPDKPFVVTPGVLGALTRAEILECLRTLQAIAQELGGLDYLQVFEVEDRNNEDLWFIEDDGEGAITALLPSEY